MSFRKDLLPNPLVYFGNTLKLTGRGKWRTAACLFHSGSDSMRVNTVTGSWVCMNCGVKGGDVLSYHMQAQDLEFVEAAKALGAWVDDGRPTPRYRPAPLPPRAALEVLSFEATLAAVAAGNLAKGVAMTEADLARLLTAANRINRLAEAYQ